MDLYENMMWLSVKSSVIMNKRLLLLDDPVLCNGGITLHFLILPPNMTDAYLDSVKACMDHSDMIDVLVLVDKAMILAFK